MCVCTSIQQQVSSMQGGGHGGGHGGGGGGETIGNYAKVFSTKI